LDAEADFRGFADQPGEQPAIIALGAASREVPLAEFGTVLLSGCSIG
jgi:hypothetical protein